MMRSDRFWKPPLVLLLGGVGLLLLGLLLLLTWRGLQEENLPDQLPFATPLVRSTPLPRSEREASGSTEERPPANIPNSSSAPTHAENSQAPAETPEPIPYNPTTSVPAVFGATGNAILTNIPYAPGLEDIANDFIEKVKQGGWDTTSEAYKKNWEQAVEEADNLVRARYGTEVYLRLKQEAAP
jgi:hypothetical protein